MNDRGVTLALAATLALLPLLPAGPQHLGLSSSSWAEAALALLLAVRLVTPDRQPGRNSPAAAARRPAAQLAWACVPFLAAVTGAALVGLAQDNPIESRAFLARLNEWTHRAFAPINQTADPLYPMRVWLTLVEGPVAFLIVTAICRRAADPARRARTALWGALAGVLLTSAFAIVQYFTRFHLHPYWVQANPDLVRTHSTFDDPNALGSYLVLGIGLSAALAFGESPGSTRPRRRGFAILAGALAAGALVTTVSRAAWASAAIAALVVAAYGPAIASRAGGRPPRYRQWSRAALALVVVLLSGWVAARVWLPQHSGQLPTSPAQAVTSTIDPQVPMTQVLKGRDAMWSAAIAMAERHPIAGVGLGRFPRLLAEYSHGAAWRENAHNFFLQILAETGAVGLAAFALLIAAVVRALGAAGRAPGGHRGLVWGLSFGCFAFMLTSLSGHPLLLASMQLVLGSTLAAGLIAAGEPEPEPDAPRSASGRRALILASSIAVLVYAVALRHTAWNGRGDPWGYSWGLYDEEIDPSGRTFRWAGGVADLYTRIPPGAEAVLLTFAAFPPENDAQPTVRVHAGSVRVDVPCPTGEWRQLRIPLDGPPNTRNGLEIRLEVDRVVVPASGGRSADTRALGVRMQPLVWMGRR